MITYLSQTLLCHLIYFQVVILIVLLSNIFLLHRTKRFSPLKEFPKISILVPVRNEERNIQKCILSLLNQDYLNFEIIAIDDASSDASLEILQDIAKSHSKLKVFIGQPLPEGWSGKNWVCAQLAEFAQGSYLFFTDADTTHNPTMLSSLMALMMAEHADFVSGFPKQKLSSWGEQLLVPFMMWASLCFIPLVLAYRIRWPTLSTSLGQAMLFQREAYQVIGGHKKLGLEVADDLTLARRIKSNGFRWRLARLNGLIECRMYYSSSEAFNGFSKNFFAAFDHHLFLFLSAFMWLAIWCFWPFIILITYLLSLTPTANLIHVFICIALSLFIWSSFYLEMSLPIYLAIFYPLTIFMNEIVAIRSLSMSLLGRTKWKGRLLNKPRWKWF